MVKNIRTAVKDRILVIDGAMGTMIQQYNLTEKDFRGTQFADFHRELQGNNDLLSMTRPDVIEAIHRAYLDAGADIIETNTFGANRISQDDYDLGDYAYEINLAAAQAARRAADAYDTITPDQPRFVAGAFGPTTKSASLSPDVNNPGYRNVTFDELVEAYYNQARGLLDGGVDALLVETIFDTLNCKAALFAIQKCQEERGTDLPIMVSGTITDASGRTLSGQTTEAFLISVSHMPLLSVGLNCALGASQLRPYLKTLSDKTDFLISAHPNAGLPNEFGAYDETPEEMANQIEEYLQDNLVNILGGCCGPTPEHISAIPEAAARHTPRPVGLGIGA